MTRFIDWDNSGGIDPVDVGVSIALDKDDDPKPPKKDDGGGCSGCGCLSIVAVLSAITTAVLLAWLT